MERTGCAFTGHRPHKLPWRYKESRTETPLHPASGCNGEQQGGTASTVAICHGAEAKNYDSRPFITKNSRGVDV